MSNMTPADALVALRSFARRYGEFGTSMAANQDLAELLTRTDSEGLSAVDHLHITTESFGLIERSLTRGLGGKAIEKAATDTSLRDWRAPQGTGFTLAVEATVAASESLAARVDGVGSGAWATRGQIEGGGDVDLMELVADAVDQGAAGLRRARSVLGG